MSNECFNCGHSGHWARQCPGLWARQCPTRAGRGRRGMRGRGRGGFAPGRGFHFFPSSLPYMCYYCGESDHLTVDCAFQDGGNYLPLPFPPFPPLQKACYKCGKNGHIAKDCKKPKRKRAHFCYNCSEPGHLARDCNHVDEKCSSCGEFGHVQDDCPKVKCCRLGEGQDTGEGNGKPPEDICQENPTDSIKIIKEKTSEDEPMDSAKMPKEDEPLGSEDTQQVTEEEQGTTPDNSKTSETSRPESKESSAVDVSGGENKIRCCKEQYCIGTWNVRSMNEGKLDMVKNEMKKVNIDILGVSDLQWTGMGEVDSGDHYIYYCGHESLKRNGVALIVNKRVQKAVEGCNLKNDRMISVRIQGKPFNVTVIQVYAPTTDAEEAEVGQFYEDLQHLLEITPRKDVTFIVGDWNATVGNQAIFGITGRFGLGVQNEAGQRLIRFCQDNSLVIANTLFQQPKRRLYTWTSADRKTRSQIDYILCRQRWRTCIQSAKTRPGSKCGSDHELLIAKFRVKLKKSRKPFRP